MAPRTGERPSVTALEGEIERVRARLSRTLALMDRGYAVRPILLRSVRAVRSIERQPGGVVEELRRDILPLSLVGIGLLWLALGRKEGAAQLRRLLDSLVRVEHAVWQSIAPQPEPPNGTLEPPSNS